MRLFTVLPVIFMTFSAPLLAAEQAAPQDVAAISTKSAQNSEASTAAIVMPVGEMGRDLIIWDLLRRGKGSFSQYQRFLAKHPDWPGLALMRKRGEAKISHSTAPDQIIVYFSQQEPRTGHGALQLARAYKSKGQNDDAEAEIVLAWRNFIMQKADRAAFLKRYKTLLKPHHQARLDMLLWQGRLDDAKRMLPLVSEGWQKLALARIALHSKKPSVDALIKAVPEDLQSDPGLAYARFYWRASKGREAAAITLLLERSVSAQYLGEPAKWANRRRSLARQLMQDGDGEKAYRVASSHHLEPGSDFADLEWLSGYLALQYLKNPKIALAHFQNFRRVVNTSISLGRAGYWEGRAYEALGNSDLAQASYEFGAEYQTSFYGLLAAEKAKVPMDSSLTGTEVFADWKTAEFMKSSVLRAALVLYQTRRTFLSKRFLLHLAEDMDRQELGQLTDFVLSLPDHHIALMIAKQGAKRGIVLPRAYYPLHDLAKEELPVATELALTIARRESEFDPVVQSGVGARGMMQLMPSTAKSVAKELKLDYVRTKLLTDWRYNAQLGSGYLKRLQKNFGNSPVLLAVAYNAGPSRARAWIKQFGDPRKEGVDVVDWIEQIPYRETRNYVMRVAESQIVYRARLAGKTLPLSITKELRQGYE